MVLGRNDSDSSCEPRDLSPRARRRLVSHEKSLTLATDVISAVPNYTGETKNVLSLSMVDFVHNE